MPYSLTRSLAQTRRNREKKKKGLCRKQGCYTKTKTYFCSKHKRLRKINTNRLKKYMKYWKRQ